MALKKIGSGYGGTGLTELPAAVAQLQRFTQKVVTGAGANTNILVDGITEDAHVASILNLTDNVLITGAVTVEHGRIKIDTTTASKTLLVTFFNGTEPAPVALTVLLTAATRLVTFTFSDEIDPASFLAADITVTGTTLQADSLEQDEENPLVWTATVVEPGSTGSVTVSVADGAYLGANGKPGRGGSDTKTITVA